MLQALRLLPRYAHGGARVLRANYGRLGTPLKLTFAVTYWCQYRCKTCNIWQKKPKGELDTDELFDFVDKNRDFSWADITGGEIFLRPDIGDVLERMLKSWRRLTVLHFATNGYKTRTITETVRRLVGLSPAHLVITVSLDGHEELNDEIRGIAGGYRHQIETFNALRRLDGVRAVLGMTLSQSNLGQVEETFRRCQQDCPGLELADFHLNVMQLSDHYYSNRESADLLPPRQQARADIEAYRQRRGRVTSPAAWLEDRYLRNVETFLASGRTPMRCHSLRSSCFIDSWGTVYPCITYAKPIGSLRENGMELAPIWRSQAAKDRQAEIWEGDCPHCWTACEAYQSIAGNLLRPSHRRTVEARQSSDLADSATETG